MYSYCLNYPLKYTDPSGMLFATVEYGREINANQSWMCDVGGSYHFSGSGTGSILIHQLLELSLFRNIMSDM